VFAVEVEIVDVGGKACFRCSEEGRAEGEAGDVFEDVGVFDGGGGGFSPCERRVAGAEDAGDLERVEIVPAEVADDDYAGVVLVAGGGFLGGERVGEWDGALEVIGVGGAEAGDGTAGLCPGGGEFGVGVDDAADGGELAVEIKVGGEVAGGAEVAFDDLAVEGGDDEVFGAEGGVIDAGGLDDDEGHGAGAVDAAGVAPGVGSEATAGDFLIGVEDFGAKGLEQHGESLRGTGDKGKKLLAFSS
jgi:hypothetical protein